MLLRFSLILGLISVSLFGHAQEKLYQGLLWEISGNGLESPSYLYGTMHVSNKLAFNVSDSFYLCLAKVDAVALESSPANWMEDYRDMGSFSSSGSGGYGSFYKKAFRINDLKNDIAYQLMGNKNRLMNQILYRYSSGGQDYQENTFLDMFIFQAGAKNNKPIYSLETLDEVIDLSILAMTPDNDKEEDNSRNNYLESNSERKHTLLEEAYRRGDLDQIDSLSKTNNPTKVYHDYFIVERNRNMVRRIDSILNTHSLFIGIGAAHLPGQGGAIELLREKGYTVRSVNPKSTGKSHKMRKKLEELYRPVDFQQTSTSDQFAHVTTPGKLFEMPSKNRGFMEYLCPEPVNGGYFSVTRYFTYGPIFGKDETHYKTTFDSLLYIATPGEIIKKENITVNGHSGYRILTLTSKNAYINYNVFFTPTELIVFKGYGIGDYIQKNEPKRFFSEIKLSESHSNWTDVSPKFGGAKWKMKGLVTGQDMIEGLDNNKVEPTYQSYDSENKEYYLVMRYTYNDLDYIEEDSFDLAHLGENFGKNLGYEIERTRFYNNQPYSYVIQRLKADEEHAGQAEKLTQKVITRGGYYYLMTTTAAEDRAKTFFDSFEFQDFKVTSPYETYTDTLLFYTAETIIPKEKREMPDRPRRYRDNENENKDYLASKKTNYHFLAQTGETIYVGYTKFHDYDGADSVSGFWKNKTEWLTEENGLIVSRREEKEIDGDLTLSFLLTDTGSAKGIMTHFRLHHGVQYLVQALIDTTEGPSDYVQHFFDTFAPSDTLIGRSIFEDKATVFFEHLAGTDSLNRVNSLKSINKIDFKAKDLSKIIETYQNFEFDEDKEQEYRENLILSLGNVEEQEAYDFLNQVYDENNFNSALQFTALTCFSYTETQEAYDAIKNQLLTNPPFSEGRDQLVFFDYLYDSLELTKNYYPDMLEMVQYADYHPYILELLANTYLKEILTYSNFKTKKSTLFRNANIELKRTVASQNAQNDDDIYGLFGSSDRINQYSPYHTLFLDYYTLMCGFKKNGDPDTEKFFEDIQRIKDEKFKVEAEIIHHKLGLPVDTAVINEVSSNVKYRLWVYNRLHENEMMSYFDSTITQEDMAFAMLYNNSYDEEKDSVVFLQKALINNGKDEGYVYFFKRKAENKKNWMIEYVGLLPTDSTLFERDVKQSKMGLSVKNDEEIEETIERTLEIFELRNRKRIAQESQDYGGFLDGFY